jgi:hypothetical protein
VAWSIAKKGVAKPTLVTSSFDFDNTAKTVALTTESPLYSITSGGSATEIGSYNATVSLTDPDNHRWVGEDGNSEPLTLEWSIVAATSIRDNTRNNNRQGIIFVSGNIVSDKAEIAVREGTITRVVIYDAIGNIVASTPLSHQDNANSVTERSRSVSWDLRNLDGRFVASGSYLVVVETKDQNGRVYRHSAVLGVKR